MTSHQNRLLMGAPSKWHRFCSLKSLGKSELRRFVQEGELGP